jgi:putative transport protein
MIPFFLATSSSVATGLATLALAVTLGLAIGAIQIRSLKLGISGVLFSSLLFGQLGFTIDPNVLDFMRDFALIVFMYAIGLQVGPGFGASLRAEGFRLNALSLCVIVVGAVMTAGMARWVSKPILPGVYAGAFNTTPGLAAAQESVRNRADGESLATKAGTAYSITYPFGVVGPMLVIIALRALFRINPKDEREAKTAAEETSSNHIETLDIEVTAAAHAGKILKEHPLLRNGDILFSRLLRAGVETVPNADTLVQVGDIYRAVGPRERLSELATEIGRKSKVDLSAAPGDVHRMDVIVTRRSVLHRSLHDLDLIRRTGVTITHINRSGIDLMPTGSLRLAFADQVTVVGPKAGLAQAERTLGNCPQVLNQSQLSPIFLGIVLGVLAGSIPIAMPGLHGSVRLGLAGGSLLAALALSRLGSVGSVIWYMPAAANQLFRDFGLAIFLACIGFEAGDHFIQRAMQNSALALLIWGALVTVLPVFLVGCFARLALKMNFISLSGWVAGAMTSSTALLFAQDMTESNSPAIAYTAVFPLAELAPIVCCQILAVSVVHV